MLKIKRLKEVVRPAIDRYFGQFRNMRISYAQEAEDLVVDKLLSGMRNGFYVEVGCHHPFRFSNTYLFYKRGWRGVCIDPLPGTANLFNSTRPRDVVIEVGVGSAEEDLTYFMFNEPALNTFDFSVAKLRDGNHGYKIIQAKKISIKRLDEILLSIKDIPRIDLMSIDVEGMDLDVLRTNDWMLFRPSVIVIECLGLDISEIGFDPVYLYLKDKGYNAVAKTGNSIIFQSVDVKDI